MRLATFILSHSEAIAGEWEAFAASLLPAARGMTSPALRDHIHEILEAIAQDISTPQSLEEQSEKSKGLAPKLSSTPDTAAQTHAVLRARGGFDINQLVAEYRALRASVLRLWITLDVLDPSDMDDVIRFNEAIDQAVAESVGHFHAHVEQSRNLLLGMLGHDMRSPLNTIQVTASYLAALNAGKQVSEAAARLITSGASMQALLDDLVDFNRTKLGLGLNVAPSEVDMAAVVANELEQLRGAHPDREIEIAVSGDTRGQWDGARLQQTLRNLVSNAIRYGSPDAPVRVALCGEDTELRLEVINNGPAIDPLSLGDIFDPLRRGSTQGRDQDAGNGLGLGLYIVREIAAAHGGQVHVRCNAGETTFAVRVPRRKQGC
jgi:signal transduction histidine kinase